MKNLNLFIVPIILSAFSLSCFKETGDREKIVKMTIYPETGYIVPILSDIFIETLLFSDSDDNEIRTFDAGFDFDYERGYKYILKVKKVWLNNPPADGSSIDYVFIELLSKTKVITEDSEKTIEVFVSSETVKFMPKKYPSEFEDDGQIPKIYDALYVKENGAKSWIALIEIKGFDYEEGYEYTLNIRKVTQANPYSIKYITGHLIEKSEKTGNNPKRSIIK